MRFTNSSDEKQRFTISINHTISDGSGLFTGFFNSEMDNDTIKNSEVVELEPKGDLERIVAVGSNEFINSSLLKLSVQKFKVLGTFPNPFSSKLTLKYRLPSDVKEVKVTLYNTLGRTVYKSVDNKNVSAGVHELSVNRTSAIPFNISSGLYVAKIAIKKKSGTLLALQKSIICIK